MTATEDSGAVAPTEFLRAAKALGLGFAWVIVDLAPDGILVTDDDGRILLANHHIEALFGYGRDTLVGTHVEALLPHHLRAAHETHRTNYVRAPALRPMGAGLELFGLHADGSEFPIEVSLSPAVTDTGIATVVIIRDVTEQRTVEHAAIATARDNDDRIASDLHDRVIGHLFDCGLTIASVIGRNQLDDRIVAQLGAVLDELDTAVKHIRDTVFARVELEPGHDPRRAHLDRPR